MKEQVVIIGAGAAGMCAAVTLARAGVRTVLLERQEKAGKKLLLTGNGRCNISNTDICPEYYQTSDPSRLKGLLEQCPPAEVLAFLDSLGIELCVRQGGYYPVTRHAATVWEAFSHALEEAGVVIRTSCMVTDIRWEGTSFKVLAQTEEGHMEVTASRVLLAGGGLAGVYHEAEKNGDALAKRVGHHIKKHHPALTWFTCDEPMKAVAGVRCDAALSLYRGERLIHRETGELQLTEKGVSGIPAFQLSLYAEDPKACELEADLLPFLGEEKEGSRLWQNRCRQFEERSLADFFTGLWQKKLTLWFFKRMGIPAGKTLASLSGKERGEIYRSARHVRFSILGTGDYRAAQVSAGGVSLSECDGKLESKVMPGLFLAGEILDVTGICGGYNLHFAIVSALLAARGILGAGEDR